jgi:hypothetical protein
LVLFSDPPSSPASAGLFFSSLAPRRWIVRRRRSGEDRMTQKDSPPDPQPSNDDDAKRESVKESIKERPDFYDVDPNKPLPPSGDPKKH